MIVHDTDLLVLGPSLLRQLLQDAEPCADGCLRLETKQGCITVKKRGQGPVRVSVTRVVFALTHPHESVSPTDFVEHTCPNGYAKDAEVKRVCIEPSHLVKINAQDHKRWVELKRA